MKHTKDTLQRLTDAELAQVKLNAIYCGATGTYSRLKWNRSCGTPHIAGTFTYSEPTESGMRRSTDGVILNQSFIHIQ